MTDGPDTTGRRSAMQIEHVARAVEESLERFEARKRADDEAARVEASDKAHLTNRVSFSAISADNTATISTSPSR